MMSARQILTKLMATTSVASKEDVAVDMTLDENAKLTNDAAKENEEQIVSHLPNENEEKGKGNKKENDDDDNTIPSL